MPWDSGKHLIILTGLSNIQRHRSEEASAPTVEETPGKENAIVGQDALGGQPIQHWYKDSKSPAGGKPESTGDLYDGLMTMVNSAIEGQKISTVTFFWMQREKDARLGFGDVYEERLRGLHGQLYEDLGRDDVHLVIGWL